jgi:hypothetical protein
MTTSNIKIRQKNSDLKKLILSCFLLISTCGNGFSQTLDTILVTISRDEKPRTDLYTVTIKNISDTPVCILHSIFINLFYDPPQQLADYKKVNSTELYSLDYAARDTSIDYEGPIDNLNGEVILPLQEIKFRLLIPDSNKDKKLQFEYVRIVHFCYPEFKNEIFKDATTWHRKYKKRTQIIELAK